MVFGWRARTYCSVLCTLGPMFVVLLLCMVRVHVHEACVWTCVIYIAMWVQLSAYIIPDSPGVCVAYGYVSNCVLIVRGNGRWV